MVRGRNSSFRRRRTSRRRAGATRSISRIVGRIAQHAPFRGRASTDPPSRVLARQISVTLCYQIYLGFGYPSNAALVSQPTPMAFGSLVIQSNSLTVKSPSCYFTNLSLASGLASSLGFKYDVGYDIALRKVTAWGPAISSDRSASLNAVTLAASGFGTDADATVMDTGTTSRRACASIRFPALNWLSHTTSTPAFGVVFGSSSTTEVVGVKNEVMPIGCLQVSLSARPGFDISALLTTMVRAGGSTRSRSRASASSSD